MPFNNSKDKRDKRDKRDRRGQKERQRDGTDRTNFRGEQVKTSNRFSSLSSDEPTNTRNRNVFDTKDRRQGRRGDRVRKEQTKKDNGEKDTSGKQNTRFKDLQDTGNAFTKPTSNTKKSLTTNNRWKKSESKPVHGEEKKYQAPGKRRPRYQNTHLSEQRQRNKFSNKLPTFNVEKENFPSLGGEKKKEDDTTKDAVNENTETIVEEKSKMNFKTAMVFKKKNIKPLPKYSIQPGWVHMKLVNGKIVKRYGPPVPRRVKKVDTQKCLKQMFDNMRKSRQFWREWNGESHYYKYNKNNEYYSDDDNDYESESDTYGNDMDDDGY